MKTFPLTLLASCVSSIALAQAGDRNDTASKGTALFKLKPADWLTLDVKSLDAGDFGLDWRIDPFGEASDHKGEGHGGAGNLDWSWRASFLAEGWLSTNPDGKDNGPKALSVTGNLFAHLIYGDAAGLNSWVNFGVSAFEFEADQRFDQFNYLFRPYVLLPVPGTNYISRWVHDALGEGEATNLVDGHIDIRQSERLFLRFGYDLVSEIEGDGGRQAENRFEVTATWRMNLIRKSYFDASYRYFVADGDNFGFLELKLGVPVTKNLHLIAKYIDGRLPVSLSNGQAISGGFSITF